MALLFYRFFFQLYFKYIFFPLTKSAVLSSHYGQCLVNVSTNISSKAESLWLSNIFFGIFCECYSIRLQTAFSVKESPLKKGKIFSSRISFEDLIFDIEILLNSIGQKEKLMLEKMTIWHSHPSWDYEYLSHSLISSADRKMALFLKEKYCIEIEIVAVNLSRREERFNVL